MVKARWLNFDLLQRLSWYILLHITLHWRHNGRDGVSNHEPHDYLLNGLFRRRSKKTSKLRVTGLCAGSSPGTGEFPAQRANNAENFSIWWRHHDKWTKMRNTFPCHDVFMKDPFLSALRIHCSKPTFISLKEFGGYHLNLRGEMTVKVTSPIARFMWPTWGPSGADRTQVGPMLTPWTLLSGFIYVLCKNMNSFVSSVTKPCLVFLSIECSLCRSDSQEISIPSNTSYHHSRLWLPYW